jgi:hypothetical protein
MGLAIICWQCGALSYDNASHRQHMERHADCDSCQVRQLGDCPLHVKWCRNLDLIPSFF